MGCIKGFFSKNKTLGEFIRFAIVGGVATLIDMFVMGIVIYAFQPDAYAHFYQVFYGSDYTPSGLSTVIGTGAGFLVGLIFNYILSCVFVFIEKGNSKSVQGFLLFTILSAIGLGIHVGGMYIFNNLIGANEWVVKIVLTIVVLIYNFITRKFLIFKKKYAEKGETETDAK